MEDRLENSMYQEDLSMYNTISILATEQLNRHGSTGTYDMKPAWLSLLSLVVNLHYYHKYKVPLFHGKFFVSSYTVAVSFKPIDDALLATSQVASLNGALVLTKNFIESNGKYTYTKLNEESEDYEFLKEVIENIIQKINVGTGNFNLHDELVDFGYMDIMAKHTYPNVGAISEDDHKYMTNKYFKGIEKVSKNKTISIKSSENVIEFNRTKK